MALEQSKSNRVFITGIGLTTPLGLNTDTTWQGLIAGRSGISTIPASFGLGDYPVTAVGLVTGEQALLNAVLPPKFHARTDRFIHLALIAGHEAMRDAGLTATNPVDRQRFGSYVGVGVGGLSSISDAILSCQQKSLKHLSPFVIPKLISNLAPAWLAMQFDLQGPVTAITNACASGTDAIGFAFRLIRDGYADYMLVGGAESCVTPVSIAGFGNMRALSFWSGDPAQASRPFDKQRSGFVMAEGAGMLVLERADLARARGAKTYAELVGYGAAADAHHVTAMHPEARGAVQAIERALADGDVDPGAVGYINAHGTSTHMNDALETEAIKKVFGAHAQVGTTGHVVVSSTKSMTGHLLGASGGVEAGITALALHHGIIPPTINLDEPDAACDLDYCAHKARRLQAEYALSNSFGFGGGNAVLSFKRIA